MDDLRGRTSAAKTYFEGTHRVLAPGETIARARASMPIYGITRIAHLTGLDRIGLPVVMVCRPNARSSAVFHGKGLDKAAAEASGLMEAIETWHAEHVQLPLRLGSVAELGRLVPLVDVLGLPRFPSGRFHPDLAMLWVEGRDFVSGGPLWVPYETVHMNATLPEPPGSGCFVGSTNGLASGNHLLEAASHALCELVERDATSLWRHRSTAARDRSRLDLGTVADDACRSVLERLERADLEVAVWDTTSDIGIPSFQALLLDRTGEVPHLGQGAGCHPTAEIALARALTEAAQVRMTYITGSREDIRHDDYHHATLEQRLADAKTIMRPVEAARDIREVAGHHFPSFEAEVAWIVERLEAVGMRQVVVVDLSRPETGIFVVRAIVPRLEGSDHLRDYAPGARALAQQRARS